MNKEDSVPLYRKIVSFFFFFDFMDLVWPLNDEKERFSGGMFWINYDYFFRV